MLEILGAFFLGALMAIVLVSLYVTPRMHRPTKRRPFVSPVLLVTAHPDDEAMFFAPTLLELKKTGVVTDLLCLSTGNFEGLGRMRVNELSESARKLGLREVRVIDSKDLPDDPRVTWSEERIEKIVRTVASEFHSRSIVTFDESGVSSHPHHVAAARALVGARRRTGDDQLLIPLFCLISLPLYRKYCALLDFLFSLIMPTPNVVYVPLRFIGTAYTCMLSHQSQMVWFRWLYIVFSVYMYKNSFVRV
ncbi:N-acetylglucosaminyl-phosphatidylinositol de-N-acetylase [Fasciola hepatica]|uniref:N-acetylglucosaminylphosphatidylinositol deacetylase n=1 Tax=Fasciola hepatica TaxID=6192 RepID=A0A4E0RVI2_FASHE|nr:N-acetylglucosaminyl-phosphatidylinositol de-N-acetylase [Fasciola hepatica]